MGVLVKALLDTNIVVHRESQLPLHKDIGVLFRWLDNLHYEKCIHPVTVGEINKLRAGQVRTALNIKLESYNQLKVQSNLAPEVAQVAARHDVTENDRKDTLLLNELFIGHVDLLITEDKKIRRKAEELGIVYGVFTIESFLEKVTAENPGLTDYKVLAVKKELFGNIDLSDHFFDSFKEDYDGFEKWFARKSEETAYVCRIADAIVAFLYLKIEGREEPYYDIEPAFHPSRKLKIGTFKVTLNGFKLGERFLKIVFDNAVRNRVEEIYVTGFDRRPEQERLLSLLEDFGFQRYGVKHNPHEDELVYVRPMHKAFTPDAPKLTYPFFTATGRVFIVPIYPEYHTNLFPDSILKTESPADFTENEPHRNAISKVYVSRSHFRDLKTGDIIVFYRTGGYYASVITTIGIVEGLATNIRNEDQFVRMCRMRSVFTDDELRRQWRYSPHGRPFVVNFLYDYSFPKRINMKRLIECGIIKDVNSAPRGFEPIPIDKFRLILKETNTDEGIVVD
jgi:hypothetical protein